MAGKTSEAPKGSGLQKHWSRDALQTALDAFIVSIPGHNPFVYEEQVRAGFSGGFGGSNFDDDKERMGYRVRKLLTGRDHIERPHSMLRHHVTNVQIEPSETADTYRVRSYFIVTRLRHTRFKDIYSGERTDVIRRAANSLGWELVKREILLDETTMLGGGIGFFF